MDAPVVPRTFAARAPMSRKRTFRVGVASPFTLMWMPPEMTKREPIKEMKLKYSLAVCQTLRPAPNPSR